MRICSIKNGEPTVLFYCSDQEEAMEWLEELLCAVVDHSLFSELNKLQIEIDTKKNPAFAIKTKIPLCIVNLILRKYNLVLIPDEKKGST